MKISIIIPHWKTAKMTAYSVSRFLKYKGDHDVSIIISDNNSGDGSIEYLEPFLKEDVTIIEYPKDCLQSHGISIDRILRMGLVKTDYFITAESDSFPTKEGWLDYYENLINQGYDCAASLLKLSGGTYHHPCGALFRKSNWVEAEEFCGKTDYMYFPNMAMKEGFACHLMVELEIMNNFLETPEDYIELADEYKPYNKASALDKMLYYSPTRAPFHNGMGCKQESVRTYGMRTVESEAQTVFDNPKMKLVHRIGAEPGQWLSWWHKATGKKVFDIPTEVKWIDGKEGHQQEYTLMENGFKHLWGVSAYHGTDLSDSDVARIKQALPEKLYDTLPEHQKIKSI